MAETNRSIWAHSAPASTARAPYGDPLADPFKAKPAGPDAGQFGRLPKILGPDIGDRGRDPPGNGEGLIARY